MLMALCAFLDLVALGLGAEEPLAHNATKLGCLFASKRSARGGDANCAVRSKAGLSTRADKIDSIYQHVAHLLWAGGTNKVGSRIEHTELHARMSSTMPPCVLVCESTAKGMRTSFTS